MKMTLGIAVAGLATVTLLATPAAAQQCKDELVSATSREYVSRSLGAFPGSWAAWRKEVTTRYGSGWQAWRRAEDRKISCAQAENDQGRKRWTCTRTARPCRPGSSIDNGTGATNTGGNSGGNGNSGINTVYEPLLSGRIGPG